MMQIATGRRLHFGLFTPVPVPELDLVFGGLGIMVDAPGINLSAELADTWHVEGNETARVQSLLASLVRHYPGLTPLRLTVEALAPAHQGWGTGTQLVMSIVSLCLQMSNEDASEAAILSLAQQLGRGKRSNLGMAGFMQGGLLHDSGQTLGTTPSPSPKVSSIPFPIEWTFLLIEPATEQGLHAEAERRAFSEITTVNVESVRELQMLAQEVLIPAAVHGNFQVFAPYLTHYNYLAGSHYVSVQHGHYASKIIESRLDQLRQAGATGLGQSSWGPGLFCLFPNRDAAIRFMQEHPVAGCRMIPAGVYSSRTSCFMQPG